MLGKFNNCTKKVHDWSKSTKTNLRDVIYECFSSPKNPRTWKPNLVLTLNHFLLEEDADSAGQELKSGPVHI